MNNVNNPDVAGLTPLEQGDTVLQCRDCRSSFIFSSGEKAFYQERGFRNDPTRCRKCRQLKKDRWRESTRARANDSAIHSPVGPGSPVISSPSGEFSPMIVPVPIAYPVPIQAFNQQVPMATVSQPMGYGQPQMVYPTSPGAVPMPPLVMPPASMPMYPPQQLFHQSPGSIPPPQNMYQFQ